MFDWVECHYPLPTNLGRGDGFQTKDLTNALLLYIITEDWRLEESSGAEDRSNFTGTLRLTWSNVLAAGPGVYTAGGEDAHYLEYAVTFVNGRVARVEELENRHEPALELSRFAYLKVPSEEEIRTRREREQERLTGRTMWLWWGGQETGYPVIVVAENSKQVVVQGRDEQFEILNRSDRDTVLFDTEEDGKRHRQARQSAWERQRQEYEEAIRHRANANPGAVNPAQP